MEDLIGVKVFHALCDSRHEMKKISLPRYDMRRRIFSSPSPTCHPTDGASEWHVYPTNPLQELDQVPVLLVRANKEPWWVTTGAAGTIQLKDVLVLELLPNGYFSEEEFPWC